MMRDWITALRTECARTSQRKVAQRLRQPDGYPSEAILSQVLSGKYPGRTDRLQDLVEGAFMGAKVQCPVLGTIGRDTCAEHQARPYAPTNHLRIQLYRACRSGCPNSRLTGETQ